MVQAEAPVERRVYEVEDVMTMLGISRNHAYMMARARAFPALRLGRRIVIPREAFDRWFENAGQPEPAA